MKVRKFWLKNAKNSIYTLADLSAVKTFINGPKGLGYSNTVTVTQYGDFLSSDPKQNFNQFNGEVEFVQSTNELKYAAYQTFINFLNEGGLKLYYQIPSVSNDTYYADVEVTSIEKTEIGVDNVMRCPIVLQLLSRWKGTEVTVNGSRTTYTLQNNGHMPVGFEITITGAMSNPYFTLEQDSEVYGAAKFEETFDEVYVNSNDGMQQVKLSQGGAYVANPLAYQDLSISNGGIYVTFVKLETGTSTLTVGYDSGAISSVEIKYTPLYRSV